MISIMFPRSVDRAGDVDDLRKNKAVIDAS
jgi:hypothetical protein